MIKFFSRFLLLVSATALVGSGATACFMRSPLPVQVWLDHIEVNITDGVAVKTYNCTFRNANARAVVGGTCYMELEPGAQVDNMSVLVDGKEMHAEILDVGKANQVFQDIVKNGGSPALLEYYGNQLIQTQVPRIAPNSTVTVKLQYTTVLPRRGGLVRLQMLNTNPKALMQPLKSASVTVNVKSQDPIKNIYSPTHKVKIVEKKDWDVAIEWSQENYMPKHPFVLYYQLSEDTVGASLVAHREDDEEGSFMLMVSPTIGKGAGKVTSDHILPKDVVFCVDTSGSMLTGEKMEQARAALKYCVESLRTGDRFNIVDFSTVARNFHDDGLATFNADSKTNALKYVSKLRARGGTAIQEALETSLKLLGNDKDRLKMIVFATDGLPTIGERDPEALLRNIAKKNNENVRIFVFGEGYDVNTKLLDFLASDHRGEADYILPQEDITKKISAFFDRVGSPIMTDLELKVDGMKITNVFPRTIPDVFNGEQVVIYGRYNGDGTKKVTLTGVIEGKRTSIEYELDFPKATNDDRSSFVPRLWAGKKVDYLLKEIRKSNGEPSKELVDEVVELAKRYGIVTPYTSFLMAEDIAASGPQGSRPNQLAGRGGFGNRRQLLDKLDAPTSAATPGAPGGGAGKPSEEDRKTRVERARESAQLSRGASKSGLAAYDDQLESELKKAGIEGSSLGVVRYIGSKTFYKRGDEWQDSVYDKAKDKVTDVEIGSDDYFKLLKEDGRVAKYLALGDVVVKVKSKWYHFVTKKS
ncbi:MAG: VIT and VWA domain-containing protein [Planctomycetota bacterium]|nr:VIT and VWA domain-containing protein [Planctomycetota bacterium]